MTSPIYWTLLHRSQFPAENAQDFLSNDEFLKFAAFRFPKRRDEWLLGRWAAKSLLHSLPAFQQYALRELEIVNTPGGAPFLNLPGGTAFSGCLSISHSSPYALAAVSFDPGIRLGVDLEKIEPRSQAFIEDYFTQAEQEWVRTSRVERRAQVANLIWSAKESMLKALGVGLRRNTRSVEILLMDGVFPGETSSGEWKKIQCSDVESDEKKWAAWWQQREEFIITLALLNDVQKDVRPVKLVEKHS